MAYYGLVGTKSQKFYFKFHYCDLNIKIFTFKVRSHVSIKPPYLPYRHLAPKEDKSYEISQMS